MYETLKNLDTVSMIDRADPDAFDADELERQAIQAEGAVVEAGTDVGKM
jgi:hypothetical protein